MIKENKKYDYLFQISNYLLLGLFSFICIYPFYYMFIYSISDPDKVLNGIYLLPAGLYFRNYKVVFEIPNIYNAVIISITRTVSGTAITVFASSFFAYLVTQKLLPGRKIIYRFIIFSMYINAGLIPVYLTYRALGLRNNFLVYIIPGAISAFYIILVKTYIEQMPRELEESAFLDGAGFMRVFVQVILPISRPIIATIAIFAAVGQWNSWFDNMIYMSDNRFDTMQYLLYNYLQQVNILVQQMIKSGVVRGDKLANVISVEPIKITMTIVTVAPILIAYPLGQKYFVKGIMLGAVKG